MGQLLQNTIRCYSHRVMIKTKQTPLVREMDLSKELRQKSRLGKWVNKIDLSPAVVFTTDRSKGVLLELVVLCAALRPVAPFFFSLQKLFKYTENFTSKK